MNRQSHNERLAAYLKKHHSQSWLASGELQRIVAAATKYTPQKVGRSLRELENEGVIEVRYEKNHAYYPTSRWRASMATACLV
jgi:DNA-binding transcriptional ArsR family regulator